MINGKSSRFINIFLAALSGIMLFCSSSLFSQEVDPFYLRRLAEGERSFLAQNYREAIKELEIAAFGLHGEKNLKAKALAYLSMCHYYLKDMENSEKYMRQVSDLMGKEEIANLEKDINQTARLDFKKLLIHFKLAPAEEKEEPPKPQEKPEKAEPIAKKPTQKEKPEAQIRDKPKIEKDPIKTLEKSIKAQPRNVSLYYELYELHRKNNNPKDAKKTIENLVKKNPGEINGFYLLGKINFDQRKYKNAEKSFEKIITLSNRTQVKENVLLETKAYLILSSYLRGDRKKAQQLMAEFESTLSLEKISSLGLGIQEKEQLERIIKTYQAQSEADRKKRRIEALETAIEDQPRNVQLYHELYDLYQEKKNVKDSKDLIQKLVKNNPDDMRGRFLLAKDEFAQNHFLDAQSHFNRILAANEQSDVNRELILKSILFTSICFYRLHKREDAQKFVRYLNDSASPAEIQRMVKEEGLEEEWEKIISDSGNLRL